jgi:formylglycine-generating enzyme required for sulfatase activity
VQIFTIPGASRQDFQTRYAAAVALGRGGDPRLSRPELNWVDIPGGVAAIGAQGLDPAGANYDEFAAETEQPVHLVYTTGFQIGRYPVTVQEYRRFVEDGGYRTAALWDRVGWRWRRKAGVILPYRWEDQLHCPNCPIGYVSWHEARAYCAWLSTRDGEANYRLPTEAEWECVARHGQAQYCRYVFGNVSPRELIGDAEGDESWAHDQDRVAPIGLFPHDATVDGVMDMNGNICEWVHDPGPSAYTAEDWQASALREPEQRTAPSFRYRRGGSWDDLARNRRSARRSCALSTNRYEDTGFRVVRVRKPVALKGALPQRQYPWTLADVYARHAGHTYTRQEADQRLAECGRDLALSMPSTDQIRSRLFPEVETNRTFDRLPCVLGDVSRGKFDFNLLYQDTRIKLAVEEKLGTQAALADCRRETRGLMEVVSVLLSTEGIGHPKLWEDLTDNDLEGLVCIVLNSYDAGRDRRLLEIGYAANDAALRTLGVGWDHLEIADLIAHQIFAGTVWWHEVKQVAEPERPPAGAFAIDDCERFRRDALAGRRDMVFLFDDNGELVWDLALIQVLLRQNSRLHITGVICNQVMHNNANWRTLSAVLQAPIFSELAASPRFLPQREDNFRPSIDPNYCSEALLQKIRAADFVLIKGVAGFETIQGLPVDTYYAFVVHSADSQITTGLRQGCGVFVRIPRGQAGYRYQTRPLREVYPTLHDER